MLHSEMPQSKNKHRPLPLLIKRLAGDGIRVAEDELNLGLLELKQIIRSYIMAFTIGAASIAVMTVAIAVLAQAAAFALTPYLGSAAYAYLGVGLILAMITVGMVFVAKHLLTKKHKPIGLIFRWLSSTGKN